MQQITERIYIGHWKSEPKGYANGILNVALDMDRVFDSVDFEYAKVGLVDGPGNHPGTLIAAACMLHQLLERNNRVMVFCHMGASRSPIVVATYLAARSKMNVWDGIQLIKAKHPRTDPSPALLTLAEIVLLPLRDILRA